MGIDIWARYSGQPSQEVDEQSKRLFSVTSGKVG
jgi:hypothetical protein